MKKIMVIIPVSTSRYNENIQREIQHSFNLPTDFNITVSSLPKGPESVECEYDCALAAPHIVELAKKAEDMGYSGIVVYCFDDPGINACKEVLQIPIVGAGESAIIMAALVGKRISILLTLSNSLEVTREVVERLHLTSRLTSIRTINTPVADLDTKADLKERLSDEALAAIEDDHADTIVLGCTGMVGVAEHIESRLYEATGYYIPVLEPGACSLHMVGALVAMNRKQSKKAYMIPPEKTRSF